MKSILSEDMAILRLPPEQQRARVNRLIREELTPLQRESLLGYYFRGLTITEMARERGVNKSTVCRILKRAEDKLRRYLKY